MSITRLRPRVPRAVRRTSIFVGLALVLEAVSRFDAVTAQADPNVVVAPAHFQDLKWRNIGPQRGGRVTAVSGARGQHSVFYQGASGGGVWKTDDYGINWTPISDGQIPTGSIGAIDVADSNPNVIYVGTGSQAIRSNVIIGKGMYKSTDAGKTWTYAGLRDVGQIGAVTHSPEESRHRLRRGARQSVRAGTRSRRLSFEGRRQELGEGAVPQRRDRLRLARDELVRSRRDLRGRVARGTQGVDDHQRRAGR